jgi:phage shock protein C
MKRDPSPVRFYRDQDAGKIGGVCAGLAEYFGFDLTLTRVLTVIGMFFFPTLLLIYLALWFLLPTKPVKLYRDEDDRDFWRGVRVSPAETLSEVPAPLPHRRRQAAAHGTLRDFAQFQPGPGVPGPRARRTSLE